MSWARIDDGFDDHPKVLALLEHEDGAAAIGLWTLCLTWAHRNTRKKGKIPGRLPLSLPRRYLGVLGRDAAKLLVEAALWEPVEDGWHIHDFDQYLPTAETSEARSEAGKRGAAARWNKQGKRAGRDGKLSSGDSNLPADRMANDGNAMASDGKGMAPQADSTDLDADDADQSTADGKLPFSDSNEPSSDGKPMASDGSRAGAHRAIPNGIAPVPTPTPDPSATSVGDQLSVDGGSGGKDAAQAPPKRTRGTRIPDDFAEKITPAMVTWVREKCPHVDGKRETEKFVNYWQAKAGKDASKLDWERTWMNWMLNAEERAPRTTRASPPPSGQSTGTDRAMQAVDAGRRVQKMIDEGKLTL